MSKIDITNDIILNLEFLHDNKDNIDDIKNGDCFDMIQNKIIKIDTGINEPENKMKEFIFNNINYNKLKILNTPYENNIIDNDKIIFKDTIILIFDNLQLKLNNIKLMGRIY